MRSQLLPALLFLEICCVMSSARAQSLKLDPPAVTGGGSSTGTVDLGAAAKADTTVKLSSDNKSVVTLPASVKIVAGQSSATFSITTVAVTSPASVSISAAPEGEAAIQTAKLQVNAPQHTSWSSMYTRAVAGIDISAGSSLPAQQHLFLEFNLTTPMPFGGNGGARKRSEGKKCIDQLNSITNMTKTPSASPKTALTTAQTNGISDRSGSTVACAKYRGEFPADSDVYLSLGNISSLAANATVGQFESDAKIVRRNFDLDSSPLAHKYWFWLNPRISAVPSQASNLLTTVSTASPSVNSLLTQQYNQVVQDFELLGGFEWVPLGPRHWAHLGDNALLGFSIIGGAGMTTPLSATQNNVQIFSLPASPSAALVTQLSNNGVITSSTVNGTTTSTVCGTTGSPALPSCTNAVAFILLNRTRFFYQEYTGIRLKTYFFKSTSTSGEYSGLCDGKEQGQVCPIFPGTFDLTVGQNSNYSGGSLHGWMLRTEAFYPLPFAPYMHLFFTTWVHVTGRNQATQPLILDTASSAVTLTSPGVQQVVLPPTNRDFYRLGLGVDLVNLISKIATKPKAGIPAASPAS